MTSSAVRTTASGRASASAGGRSRRGDDDNLFAQLLGLCTTPDTRDDPDVPMHSALNQVWTELKQQKQYFEAALATQHKKHSEEILELRARLLDGATKKGEVTDTEVAELQADLRKIHELDEKVEALSAELKAAHAEGLQSSKSALDDFKKEVADLKARALLVPASEAEMDDLRKRVDETAAMKEDDHIAVAKPSSAEKASSKSLEEKAKMKQEEAARQKREEEVLSRHELFAKYSIMIAVLKQENVAIGADVSYSKAQAKANLESLKTLREDMHRNIEAVSIKAGYLALALTDNNEEEKRRVYGMLKEKEKALTGTAAGLLLYTTVNDESDLGLGESVDMPTLTFSVTLDRTSGESLGLKLRPEKGTSLLIERIEDGLAKEHNRTCLPPAAPLKEGDRIIQVNEVKGYVALLERELDYKKEHHLVVQRSS